MKRIKRSIFILIMMMVFSGCVTPEDTPVGDLFGKDVPITKSIRKVDSFPDIPENYAYVDYKEKARALDELVFRFAENDTVVVPNYRSDDPSTWDPIGFWDDSRTGIPDTVKTIYYKDMFFGLPTYVGDRRSSSDGPHEAITSVSTVLGSSFVGMNKSAQMIGSDTHDFVNMTKAFYDVGLGLVLNTAGNTIQGKSIWYDLFPQIAFTRLYHEYPEDEDMKAIVLRGADVWLEALPHMVDDEGNPDFEYTGFDVRFNLPFVGSHIEPPNGGLAFLFYSAYRITGENRYLNGAIDALDYLETYRKNPNYEAMSDYGFYVAAILNLEHGTDYDVQKFIEFVFENDSAFRPGWSVLSGTYGGYPVHGLVGDQSYAFSMNSFHLASTLAPMAKYDPRFATDIGKYFLNLTNSARWFFPGYVPLSHQTMNGYLSFDQERAVIYEGFRSSYNGVSPLAMGDATALFGSPSDLSLYSSSHLGHLGAIVDPTNVKGILELDLNATDSLRGHDHPTHLYYNPYASERTIEIDLGTRSYDLFDLTNKEVVARDVTGKVDIDIPANGSRIIMRLPAHTAYTVEEGRFFVAEHVIASDQASVNVLSPGQSKASLRNGDSIRFSYQAPRNDEVVSMTIRYDDIVVYEGEPIETYEHDSSLLTESDYELIVLIETANGLTDKSSTRIINQGD